MSAPNPGCRHTVRDWHGFGNLERETSPKFL
jgi:hypothetical protein